MKAVQHKALLLLLIVVVAECGQVVDTSQNLLQYLDDGVYVKKHRNIAQRTLTLFQGVLNVLWTGTLILVHVILDNQWAGPVTLQFLKHNIQPAISGTIQVKMVVFTNGLIAVTRGTILVLESLRLGFIIFLCGLVVLVGGYASYLRGQLKASRRKQKVDRETAEKTLKTEMWRDRVDRVRDTLRSFSDWEIAPDQEAKAEIEQRLADHWAMSGWQFEKFKKANNENVKQELMRDYERNTAQFFQDDADGKVEIEERFCCDLKTDPSKATVRFQNTIKDLHAELHRLMDEMEGEDYFEAILNENDGELAKLFENNLLPRATMEKMILDYDQARQHQTNGCESGCVEVSDFVMERFAYDGIDYYSSRQCCERDPTKGEKAECKYMHVGLEKHELVQDGSTTCGPYCDVRPASISQYCTAIYTSAVYGEKAMWYMVMFPVFVYAMASGITLLLFYNSVNWDVFHTYEDEEGDNDVPATTNTTLASK